MRENIKIVKNPDLSLLQGYPDHLISQVKVLIEQEKLKEYLQDKYPESHEIRTDKALNTYVQDIKKTFMKKAGPIHKVSFDDRLESAYNALGLHSFISRVQGSKLKSKNEIKIASVFKKAPADLLYMIVIHELAHLKEKDHNKNFYRLCRYMDGDYSQHEFDVRLFLMSLDKKSGQ